LPRDRQPRQGIGNVDAAPVRPERAGSCAGEAGSGVRGAPGHGRPGPHCLPLLHPRGRQHGQTYTGMAAL